MRYPGWHRRPGISGKDCDPDHHADAAAGATVAFVFGDCLQQLTAIHRLRQQVGDGNDEQFAAKRQFGRGMAVGKKAEVADTLEAGRQRVDEKTPDELVGGHLYDLTASLWGPQPLSSVCFRACNPSTGTRPGRLCPREAADWIWRHGAYNGRGAQSPVVGRRTGAWRKPPIRGLPANAAVPQRRKLPQEV
jgi:hypothetical protein